MLEGFEIRSHIGPYRVHFIADGCAQAAALLDERTHFLVDREVARLYGPRLEPILGSGRVILIDADETAKSLEQMPRYVMDFVGQQIRRDHRIIAIGGGVTQDITCFLAATMMRGIDWLFIPTTLLAQADSCIGSKSSINVGEAKNILGTFTPPREVFIDVGFIRTLHERDVRSGIGEILKVHAIEGPDAFGRVAADYPKLIEDSPTLMAYIRRALLIKKPFVETDEFDRAERQIFNYGHSFGHAIESATDFAVPHGIAVTMGMDMANFVSGRLGFARDAHFASMHGTLARNFRGFETHPVPHDRLFAALGRDKKNSGAGTVTVILPDSNGRVVRTRIADDDRFRTACGDYLAGGRTA